VTKEVRRMATKAYFLIRTNAEAAPRGYPECMRELEAMPEVEFVEPVRGPYDLLAALEAPATALSLLVDRVMANTWVECVHVLRADEPDERALDWEEARAAKLRRQRNTIRAYRTRLRRLPRSEERRYAGLAAAIRAENEETRSLSRQLEIIKPQYDKLCGER
jgi:hypothetical protein